MEPMGNGVANDETAPTTPIAHHTMEATITVFFRTVRFVFTLSLLGFDTLAVENALQQMRERRI
jgi:hypothetical protein